MRPQNETPEQKAERLERHKKYLDYIIRRFFRHGESEVFGGAEYWDCKLCYQHNKSVESPAEKVEETVYYSEKDATDHYFAKHWTPKAQRENQETQNESTRDRGPEGRQDRRAKGKRNSRGFRDVS